MAINFPSSPTLHQIFTSGGNSFIWNGKQWVGYSTSLTVNYNASSLALASNDSPVGATTSLNFDSNFDVQTLTGITTVSFSSTYIANSGYSTYSNYSNTSGVSTYSTTSGIASYANVAGISSGISTSANINTTGIITSKSFYGSGIGLTSIPANQLTGSLPAIDGSALINISAVGTGITVRDDGSIYKAGVLDFGKHLTVDFVTGTATINVTSSPRWDDNNLGIHTLSNVGIGTTNPTSRLTVGGNANILGVITATTFSGSFSGDGSGLTGVTAEGTGIEIRDGASNIGIASIINFADYLSVSPLSAGIVTVASTTPIPWISNSTGIHTTSNVGIGTTNATSPLTVSGNVFVSGNVNSQTSSSQSYGIKSQGLYADSSISSPNQHILITNNNVGGDIVLRTSFSGVPNTQQTDNLTLHSLENFGKTRVHYDLIIDGKVGVGTSVPTSALTVTGTTFTNNLSVSGIATIGTGVTIYGSTGIVSATNFYGNGSNLTGVSTTKSRTTLTATTGSIGAGSSTTLNISGFKTYALLKVGITSASWVRIYTDSTSRNNDINRIQGVDPEPDAGVIAEVVSTGATTFIMSPGIIGWNNDNPVSETIYMRINNNTGVSAAIGVTLTVLKMED